MRLKLETFIYAVFTAQPVYGASPLVDLHVPKRKTGRCASPFQQWRAGGGSSWTDPVTYWLERRTSRRPGAKEVSINSSLEVSFRGVPEPPQRSWYNLFIIFIGHPRSTPTGWCWL